MTCRSIAVSESTRQPFDLGRVHRLDRVIDYQETERAGGHCHPGRNTDRARALTSPWLMTERAAPRSRRRDMEVDCRRPAPTPVFSTASASARCALKMIRSRTKGFGVVSDWGAEPGPPDRASLRCAVNDVGLKTLGLGKRRPFELRSALRADWGIVGYSRLGSEPSDGLLGLPLPGWVECFCRHKRAVPVAVLAVIKQRRVEQVGQLERSAGVRPVTVSSREAASVMLR